MDSAVGDELFEGETRDFAAYRIEARHNDRIRRVIDDDVNSGGELERANVPALAADDAPLHLIVWKRDGGNGGFYALFGRDPLDGQCDYLLRLALGVPLGGLANLADLVCRVGVRLILHSMHEFRLRVGSGESSQRLSSPSSLSSSCSRSPRVFSRLATVSIRFAVSRSRCSSRSYLRLSWPSWSSTLRSSRSFSSRRPRTSTSHSSRSLMSSSLPLRMAVLRRLSASRSASPTILFEVSSAVAFACCWRSSSARPPNFLPI